MLITVETYTLVSVFSTLFGERSRIVCCMVFCIYHPSIYTTFKHDRIHCFFTSSATHMHMHKFVRKVLLMWRGGWWWGIMLSERLEYTFGKLLRKDVPDNGKCSS